jgi:hypothetical protein
MSHDSMDYRDCSCAECDALRDSQRTTVDITPTWRSLMPALVEVAARGRTAEGRKTAMDELLRLADVVDRMCANAKAKEGK